MSGAEAGHEKIKKSVIKILDLGAGTEKHHDFRCQRAVNKRSHLDNVRIFRKAVRVGCAVV